MFCCSERVTPGAVWTFLVSILRFEGFVDIFAVVILDTWDEKAGLVKVRSVWL